jgi:hypothetical protein
MSLDWRKGCWPRQCNSSVSDTASSRGRRAALRIRLIQPAGQNPPESNLIFQVTVIGLRNQRVCDSAFSLDRAHDALCCNPLH